MDMYQKREQRKKNKIEDKNNAENSGKININCLVSVYLTLQGNPYE